MERDPGTRAQAVLRALADLSPSGEQRAGAFAVPTEWFRWLPLDALRLLGPEGLGTTEATVSIDRHLGERLAAVDRLRPEQHSLRVGWLFVAGRIPAEDKRMRRVFLPLVTMPVRVQRGDLLGGTRLAPAGDVQVTERISDATARHRLEAGIERGGGALDTLDDVAVDPALLARLDLLHTFATAAAAAAELPANGLVPAGSGPDELMRATGLVIVAGIGVYAVHETSEVSRAGSLLAWASEDLGRPTAFHALYAGGDAPATATPAAAPASERLVSSFPLTPVQREAVVRSRTDAVTLLSGAPGTGKSHAVAAIACEALARGERVLVAAKADATVDALLDLLQRAPGPDPVVFGSNERRSELATRLAEGHARGPDRAAVQQSRSDLAAALERHDALRSAIAWRLAGELLLDGSAADVDAARGISPGLFDHGADLAVSADLLTRASAGGDGWFARRRRHRARRRLDRVARSAPARRLDEVAWALGIARTAAVASALVAEGGLEVGEHWEQLGNLDANLQDSFARWLAAESRSPERFNPAAMGAVAALATALRSGRGARRAQLARLDDDLTRALPLWLSTLGDVDDLLPPEPALFDLVILDEASSIDQPLAAPALLRARRAVIAGDPRQLRHVSFLSDDELRAAIETQQLDDDPALAARLDVRRNSVFDVAAAVAPVLTLDEHFRSDPHLVDFVARRLYDGRVKVATRSPRTESIDCVDLLRLDAKRDRGGVVRLEVDAVVQILTTLQRQSATSVGVVTPFRAQADALESAVLKAFTVDEIEALDLRVGTVHAFQGNERDVVIASLGLGPDDVATSWRFVEDPHLFAVFVTRARKRLTFVYSAEPPEGGLVAEYLAQADRPPGRPAPAGIPTPWVAAIAEDLAAGGLPVLTGYPTGRHVVDLCVLDPRCLALECEVHPDGAEAHIERHLALRRAGWQFLDAYRSRWGEQRPQLVVELIGRLRQADS